eukprot:TRINITY_DN4639_c0_g1_i1.p1 TRINITY_DN4639_c0_g1~~TRINITY_DN4639_c0_g1_i1.p1  ORF type:complete len:522 (-),score=121.17 TRINITY_DN4639_c0_g1_i1:122-1687(-)
MQQIHKGWLHKKGPSGLKAWRLRWFELENGTISYFKNKGDKLPVGSFQGTSITRVRATTIAHSKKLTEYAFAVTTPIRTYYLGADSQEEKDKWFSIFKQFADAPVTTSSDSPFDMDDLEEYSSSFSSSPAASTNRNQVGEFKIQLQITNQEGRNNKAELKLFRGRTRDGTSSDEVADSPDPPVEDSNDISSEILKLKSEVSKLSRLRANTHKRHQELTIKISEAENRLLLRTKDSDYQSRQNLRRSLDHLRKEIIKLNQSLNEASLVESPPPSYNPKQLIETLRQEISLLKRELDESHRRFSSEHSAIQNQLIQEQEAHKSIKSSYVQLEAENTRFISEIQDLNKEIEMLKMGNSKNDSAAENLEKFHLEFENFKLAREHMVKSVLSENTELKLKVESAVSLCKQIQTGFEAEKSRAKELEEQNSYLSSEVSRLKDSFDYLSLENLKLGKELEETKDNLLKQTKAKKKLKKERQEFKSKNQVELNIQLAEAHKQVSTLQQQLIDAHNRTLDLQKQLMDKTC